MPDGLHELLPEEVVSGQRLGRNVNHDPLSRGFAAQGAATLRTVTHRRYGRVLDQGNLGACTGFALAQALNTAPLHRKGEKLLTAQVGRDLYSRSSTIDPFPGSWPPTDTGSDGNSVCKAGRDMGYLSEWRHCFSTDDALGTLTKQPIITGTIWTAGMDRPDEKGFLNPRVGRNRGGHEYTLIGLNVKDEYVIMLNSWSAAWGNGGRAKIRFADYDWLLSRNGDATVPIR